LTDKNSLSHAVYLLLEIAPLPEFQKINNQNRCEKLLTTCVPCQELLMTL
jgi:hypothetical protein